MNLHETFRLFAVYTLDVLWPLALGFGISGLINEFMPQGMVNRYLGRSGVRPLFAASFFGALLPVCCFGTLPVAVTLYRKGARLGPVLAFLVATPATSASALLVSAKLMGPAFTLALFCAVLALGLLIGLLANAFEPALKAAPAHPQAARTDGKEQEECPHCRAAREDAERSGRTFFARVMSALGYAFITLPRTIGVNLVIGIALAAAVESSDVAHTFIAAHLAGAMGYIASLALALSTYVCSTAGVPVANALRSSGLSAGAAFVFLLAGPITSYGAILVVWREFGARTLGLYLGVISVFALMAGWGFGMLFG